ncbi:MAG: toll/interleukin-1 receptor domain-containing protein [Candidatus Geothermarchaeales archaeon]
MTSLLAKDVRGVESSFVELLEKAPGTKEDKQTFFRDMMKSFVPRSTYVAMWERLVRDKGAALAGEAVFNYVLHHAPDRLQELLQSSRAGKSFRLQRTELAVTKVLFFKNGKPRRICQHLMDYMEEITWTWRVTVRPPLATASVPSPGYDVALSFAGENRDYVSEVASELQKIGVRVFYDEFEETEMWGKDLATYLEEVINRRARYFVMFLSVNYARKAWPSYEGQVALGRAIERREEYILPVRFDNAPFPGLPSTIKYLNARQLTPRELAKRIARKISK